MDRGPQSYTFGSGRRRHAVRSKSASSVGLWCGMSGYVGDRLYASDAQPDCKACLKAMKA